MSEGKPPAGAAPAAPRAVPTALRPLQWMGIPQSILTWKPRLPSRNWSIFWLSVTSLSLLYYEDRRQCKKILEEYKERVRGLAEEPMSPKDLPRKVTVYTAKYPGDDDYEVGALYFRRYVKPILVAAAVDYEIISGTRYGGLARDLRDRIHERRRNLAGVLPWPSPIGPNAPIMPFLPTPAQQLQRELDGAVVIVGRPALKEWAWAMKEGWDTEIPVKPVDHDEALATRLSDDNTFEEDEPPASAQPVHVGTDDEEPMPLPTKGFMLPSQVGFQSMNRNAASPFASRGTAPAAPDTSADAAEAEQPKLAPPSSVPAQPPMCFVDFTNLVGWRNIPRRIVHFFNHRDDVRRGAELGLSIVLGTKNDAREFDVGAPGTISDRPPQGGDLDWGLSEEDFYPRRFEKTPSEIVKDRERFYEALRDELKASREILRGEREPTRTEKYEMPHSEIELRDERFNKERDWQNLLHGYEILTPSAGVTWNESWRGSLRVLRPRSPDEAVPRRVYEVPAEEAPVEAPASA
ncbi:TIM54 [Malassezia furfur]|nr:TIM54 [Malassezia furfur]